MSRKGTKKLIPPLLNFELGNQMELGIWKTMAFFSPNRLIIEKTTVNWLDMCSKFPKGLTKKSIIVVMIMEHVKRSIRRNLEQKKKKGPLGLYFYWSCYWYFSLVPGLDYNFLQCVTWTILQGKHLFLHSFFNCCLSVFIYYASTQLS